MNLYSTFGSMLESMVGNGYPEASCYSENALEKLPEATSSPTGSVLRSESEDSGVDLSNVGSPKASRSSVVTSEDSLALKQAEETQPSSSSPSPSLSSSSSSCFSVAQNSSTVQDGAPMGPIFRTNQPDWTQAQVLDAGPRRRCNTTSLTRGLHTTTGPTPHRTGSFRSRRPHTQPDDHHTHTHTPDHPQLDLSSGDPAEADWTGLSPGLLYLERVCRMLEEMARLQKEKQNLQIEMSSVCKQKHETHKETASIQTSDISSVNKRSDVLLVEDESKLFNQGFRRRTVSDTWAFLRHRNRKVKTPQIEPFGSTDVLHEEPDGNLQLPLKTEQKRSSSSLKERISSLRKNEKSNQFRTDSLHGEKSVFRLFKNRRKTTRH